MLQAKSRGTELSEGDDDNSLEQERGIGEEKTDSIYGNSE